ncbi:MAG: DUF1772 domain-containing protein [Alphaproteobacteria bacterium]|nr:DUF1772 domain-containing protein [Alphaproteobacteria bacterium]
MFTKTIQFLALALTAIALVPSGAHLFELPHKIVMSQDQYFIVQGIYAGWSAFGFVLIPALIVNLGLAYVMRSQPWPALLSLVAGVLIAATLATFFTWIYPANQATANWTTVPADWETLRSQWEHTHALNAVLTFAAFAALTLALIVRR